MPGNEVGDRVHNFFDQGSLSQDQRHTQFVAPNWSGYNNNIWNANERQIGGPVNTGLQNHNPQQSDIERGQGNQFSLGPNGLNFAQQNLRPEFVKNSSQLPHLNSNGFMHGSQISNTRHNESNFLGVDTESDRHNMTSRRSVLESELRSGPQFMNPANFGASESSMNFNIFSGQHQMNGQQPGMMQSLPPQQLGNNNTQLQQQFILKQMELQRHHQLQQFEAMQRSAANHIPPMINGNPFHDASNNPWSCQVATSNASWQQRGVSGSVPSNGFMVSPEQGQAMQFMGLIPQQTSQSLYGVPVSGSRSCTVFSHSNIDKPGMVQVSAPSGSFSGNQYDALSQPPSVKENNNMVSKCGSEGKTSFGEASSQRIGNIVNLGGFTQVQHRNVSMSESGGHGFAGGLESVTEKPLSQASSQGASTQDAIGLDPTEEKILFGNDDNIWEAFGGAPLTGSGDATDLVNGLTSMQSGTWSALMQSAVAETSSNDGGMQEEWSGLGSQNSQPNSNDVNIYNANSNINYANSLGQQQRFINQRRDSLQTESHFAQQTPHVAEKRVVENSNSSRNFSSTDAGFWGHQQSTFVSSKNVQQSSQPSSSNFIGSVPSNGGITPINQDNFLGKEREMQMRMDTVRGAIKMGSSHASSKDDAIAPGLSNMKVDLESSQKLPNNNHLDLWKSNDSSEKYGFEGFGREQHNLNKGPSISESIDNSPDGGGSEMHETENADRRESSSDSHRGGLPSNASVGSLRENMWSDSADRRSLPSGIDMPSGQAGKRGPISRKFQYHPMGDNVNLDSYAGKHVLQSQSMSQDFSGVKGQEVNPRFLGPLSTNIADMEGRVSNYHGTVTVSRGAPGSMHPDYLPNMSSAFVRSGEISLSNQHLSPSQNMLELLHKVDQFKEQNASSLSSTDDSRLSDTPVGGVAGPSQNHLSTSHGFSLQLAPPSQVIARSNLSDVVQSSSRTMGSPSTGHVATEKEDKYAWLSSLSSSQCLPSSHQPTQMDSRIEPLGNMDIDVSLPNLKDNSSISSWKIPSQSEHSAAPDGKIIGDQYANMVVENDSQPKAMTSHAVNSSHDSLVVGGEMNQPNVQGLMRQMPAAVHNVMAGMSRKDNLSHLGNLWASQQYLLGAQARQLQSLNASEPSFTEHKKDEQVDVLSSQGIGGGVDSQAAEAPSPMKVAGKSQEEPSARHRPDASASCPTINQKDIEPFHANNSCSLMPEVQTMKNLGSDPSYRESKRLKGQDGGHDLKQIAGQAPLPIAGSMSSMARYPSMSQTSVAAGDAKMLNFSPQLGNRNTFQFPHGAVTSRTEHTGISPQMAPSWFEQYGTFKNGQLLQGHNLSRFPMKNVEQQFISGNSPNNLVAHNPSLASMTPKKRKTATSDLLPWNKEIGQCLKRLQNLSSAEVDWAESSNRLIEKVGDENDYNEDLLSMTIPRRRLILTTQLMQQVLQPPSAVILSRDASFEYELIVYSLARLELGDACSLICGMDSNLPVESSTCLTGKVKASERIQDQYFSKVVEDFVSREKELENELLRLEKRASILDFRLDCQDLERFSVINRFARFHGRGAETSSSSDTNATVLKHFPQRYVSAHPMPRNVPERVQCLSL